MNLIVVLTQRLNREAQSTQRLNNQCPKFLRDLLNSVPLCLKTIITKVLIISQTNTS